jgi:hypothetical protein
VKHTDYCKQIKKGTTDAKATTQLSSADSASINSAVANLIPLNAAALTALKAKKTQFATDGITSTVQSSLTSLKTETDDLATALIAIASTDALALATTQKATIDSDL